MALQGSGTLAMTTIRDYWVNYGQNRGYALSGYLNAPYYNNTGFHYFPGSWIAFSHFYGASPADEWYVDPGWGWGWGGGDGGGGDGGGGGGDGGG